MTRIVYTQIHGGLVDDQPVVSRSLLPVRKFHVDNDIAPRQSIKAQVPMNVPHQKACIQVFATQLAFHPALPPYSHLLDQGPQLLPRRSHTYSLTLPFEP